MLFFLRVIVPGALKCIVCNSGNHEEEACENATSTNSIANKFTKNCSTFDDFMQIMESSNELNFTALNSSRALITFPDWTMMTDSPNYRTYCKMVKTDTRAADAELPGTKSNL